jgi:beta-glucosidase
MKRVSLLLAIVMLMSVVSIPVFAEGSVIKESASGFYYVEANGNQPRLSAASKDKFIQADGLYFKDLNGNGALDVYEDWRVDTTERVNDLMAQMTIKEKAGTLFFSGIGGKNGIVVSNLTGDVSGQNTDAGTASIAGGSEILTSHEVVVTIDKVNYSPMAYQIQDMGVNTFIAAMTGTPKDQLDLLNAIQKIGEESRLGIPAVFSGDRSYNTWGGMIDMAHYAFSVAHDDELLYKLVSEYAKESVALGYQQVFHGYGNEIGSWYGDDVNYIAKMATQETRAYEDNGFNSHSKHFIARGGRNSYSAAKSPADLIDSWKVGWKAVVDAGTQWIMSNNNVGVTPGLQAYMDKATYSILRDELGYDGIVCLDWPLDISRLMSQTGITTDGVDISTLSAEERYALILNVGVDMFSALGVIPGTDIEAYADYGFQRGMPDLVVSAVEKGLVTEEVFNKHVFRVLRNKYNQGIFEDPYRDWEDALALIGSDAYKAEQTAPMSNAEINNARRSEITEMEEKLMVESSILLKNEGILPLAKGVKLYVESNNDTVKEADAAAMAAYGTVVGTLAEADTVVLHATAFDDAYDLMVEDAQAAGKQIILVWEGTIGRNGVQGEPYLAQVTPCAAVLMQTYNNTPDHGSSIGSFYRYVTPSITADMLFGVKEPSGSTVFEVPLDAEDYGVSWGELQDDIGVSNATRLYMAMMAKQNPSIDMPNNLGDVLYTTNFGMNYSKPAVIECSLLAVPQTAEFVQTESNGRVSINKVVSNAVQKAGVPFEINFVAKNSGGDGHVTVEVLDGGNKIAEKFVALDEGQFRVISINLTLEAGEHVISVAGMTQTIVVE